MADAGKDHDSREALIAPTGTPLATRFLQSFSVTAFLPRHAINGVRFGNGDNRCQFLDHSFKSVSLSHTNNSRHAGPPTRMNCCPTGHDTQCANPCSFSCPVSSTDLCASKCLAPGDAWPQQTITASIGSVAGSICCSGNFDHGSERVGQRQGALVGSCPARRACRAVLCGRARAGSWRWQEGRVAEAIVLRVIPAFGLHGRSAHSVTLRGN